MSRWGQWICKLAEVRSGDRASLDEMHSTVKIIVTTYWGWTMWLECWIYSKTGEVIDWSGQWQSCREVSKSLFFFFFAGHDVSLLHMLSYYSHKTRVLLFSSLKFKNWVSEVKWIVESYTVSNCWSQDLKHTCLMSVRGVLIHCVQQMR